jgi:hypothetical protein
MNRRLQRPDRDNQDGIRPMPLREEKARHGLCIELGCCRHSFVRLAGQLLNTDIRKDSGEGIGDIEVASTLGPDLEQNWNSKLTKAIGFEVVPAQRT